MQNWKLAAGLESARPENAGLEYNAPVGNARLSSKDQGKEK